MINEAPKLAFKNKTQLQDDCSCYYCLKNFKKNEIINYTDKGETALCPYCNIDAVLPGIVSNLKEIKDYWF